jgi:hypothetical protein
MRLTIDYQGDAERAVESLGYTFRADAHLCTVIW